MLDMHLLNHIFNSKCGDTQMKKMSSLDWLTWVLVVVGALNWGFIGLSNLNVVEAVLGAGTALTQFAYILIGLSGVYSLWVMKSAKSKPHILFKFINTFMYSPCKRRML